MVVVKRVDQLLLLPLADDEESALVSQLRARNDTQAQELLVLHFLQRSRVVEASRLNARLRQQPTSGSAAHAPTRSSIVDGFQRSLPSVQRKLVTSQQDVITKRAGVRKQCEFQETTFKSIHLLPMTTWIYFSS